MRKKKNNVYVGLDGLDIKVNTTKVLEQNYYIFYNKNNDEIGHLQAVKDGYLLHLCLPKVLRNDNTIPFCKEDFKHIENVLACVQTQLESLFGNAIYEEGEQAQISQSTVRKLSESAKRIAQAKRMESLKQRKDYVMGLEDAPPLLCINELSYKTGLPFQLLRKLIIEEHKIPFIKLSNRYYINYNHFISYLEELN